MEAQDTESLGAPLLPPAPVVIVEEDLQARRNFWDCTFNLTKVILGAGIMAIPKAVALLGWGPGLVLLLLVGLLTHFTVHGLVYASDRCGRDTYSGLVRAALGPAAEKVLQAVMLAGCLGFEVVYLDFIGDLLVGEVPDRDGLITRWLPEETRLQWYVSRPFVLAALTAGLLAPLTSLRTMGSLGLVNVVGLGSLAAFAVATVAMGAAAVAHGSAHMLPALPDVAGLGPDTASRVTGALAVVPVLLTAASCHQSVHPLRSMLVPYKPAVLDRVVALSLANVTALYVVVALAAYTAFGSDIRGNFLNNLTPSQMAPLLGEGPALAVSMGIKAGYGVSLVGSAVLIMFPLRQSLLELVAPKKSAPGAGQVPQLLFLSCTYGLLATIYVLAVAVPSIWDVISFVGGTACTVLCFILPAALIIKYKDEATLSHRLQRAAAWATGALGAFLFVNCFFSVYLTWKSRQAPAAAPPAGGVVEVGAWAAQPDTPGSDGGLWDVVRWAGWGA